METAEALVISRLRWSLFGTLTFRPRNEGMSTGRQVRMFFAFARTSAKHFGVYFPHLEWVLRSERGETFGREHLHFLLGAPVEITTKTDRFTLMHSWEKLGGGMARIDQYETRRTGVEYVCKCLGMERPQGANVYELNKFGSSEGLTLSRAATFSIRKYNDRTGLRVAGSM